jgi:hypothetical protein
VKRFVVGLKQSGFAKKKKSAKLRNKLPKKKKMVKKFKVGASQSYFLLFKGFRDKVKLI